MEMQNIIGIVCSKQYINNSNGISDSISIFCPACSSLSEEYISDEDAGFFLLDAVRPSVRPTA